MPLLTLTSSIQVETQKSNRGSLWHRRCCAYTRVAVLRLLTHATTYGRHTATQVTLVLWFNYVKKTDAIGYIANQTNEYPYTQSNLVCTQVCTHYTQVTCEPTHRYTQECKSCATSKTWVPPKGVIMIRVDNTRSHIFLPKYD